MHDIYCYFASKQEALMCFPPITDGLLILHITIFLINENVFTMLLFSFTFGLILEKHLTVMHY